MERHRPTPVGSSRKTLTTSLTLRATRAMSDSHRVVGDTGSAGDALDILVQ